MKRIWNFLALLLILAGLSVVLYPYCSNTWNIWRQKRLMVTYEEQVSRNENKIKMEAERKKAIEFNEALLPMLLPDSFVEAEWNEEEEAYWDCLNINGDGIMGIVEIPKINVRLPIYHTTRAEVLELGAGHLHGSSLPVGGENTHAVISAHRGLPSAVMFTDLDQMRDGDHFLLHVLDDILCYEVDQIETVMPDETELLNVIEGEDFVTLLTCTPYGVNTMRLLVRGHRVPYVPESVKKEENTAGFSVYTNYEAWVAGCIGVTVLFALTLSFAERKFRKKKHQ